MEEGHETPPEITESDFTPIKAIGYGSSGSVILALCKITNSLCAIKKVPLEQDDVQLRKIEKEIDVMVSLDYPFVTKIFGHFRASGHLHIVMEHAERGNLHTLISREMRVSEYKATVLIRELLMALDYLHSKRHIIHRDIKLENILLDKYGHVKLSDFGLAEIRETVDALRGTACGTPAYASPEMIMRNPYTTKTDVWSVGVIMYTLLTGELPFKGTSIQECFTMIIKTDPVFPEYLSPVCVDLIKSLLDKDPEDRLSAREALGHPWFIQTERIFAGFGENLISPADCEELSRVVAEEFKIKPGFLLQMVLKDQYNRATTAYHMLKTDKITKILKNQLGMWDDYYKGKHLITSVATSLSVMDGLSRNGIDVLGIHSHRSALPMSNTESLRQSKPFAQSPSFCPQTIRKCPRVRGTGQGTKVWALSKSVTPVMVQSRSVHPPTPESGGFVV